MIPIKTKEEIERMREGGKILARILGDVKNEVRPGVSTHELDSLAERLIEKTGGKPSFKMVPRYKWATCMCVNEVVVHGAPGSCELKKGDILGIDIGIFYKGFHADMAETVIIGEGDENLEKFIKTGKEALAQAIRMAKVGNQVGHISKTIQETIEAAGFSPVRALVGHGIGKNLHEEPQVPCFLRGKLENTPRLKVGMTLAIEVIYNQGTPDVIYRNDDSWTVQTADLKLSGLFEHTVAIGEDGPEILTLSLPNGLTRPD